VVDHREISVPEFLSAVRPYVMPPERLPSPVAEGAPVVLPGLVMAVAVGAPEGTLLQPMSVVDAVGRDAVWSAALGNVRNLDGIDVTREQIHPDRQDTEVVALWADDRFVASRVAVVEWLVEHIYGGVSPWGVLVSVPTTSRLLLHVPAGPGVVKVAGDMAILSAHWCEAAEASRRISPDVHCIGTDRRAQRISRPGVTGPAIDTTTPGPFPDLLSRLIPGFVAPTHS
jgi:hypothetical protein